MARKRKRADRGKPARRPTEAELAILRVLWQRSPGTVREVNRILNETRETGYNTTLKLMQIMTDKGLLVRDESVRPQLFHPAVAQERTQQQMLEHLIDGAYGGSASKLVVQALSVTDLSQEEIARVEKLLSQIEGDRS